MEDNTKEVLVNMISDGTRQERRNLILVSAISAYLKIIGVYPQKIEILGMSLRSVHPYELILFVLAILYFLISFSINAFLDYVVWLRGHHSYIEKRVIEQTNWSYEDQLNYDEMKSDLPNVSWTYEYESLFVRVRIVFDLIAPFVIGICTLLFVCLTK